VRILLPIAAVGTAITGIVGYFMLRELAPPSRPIQATASTTAGTGLAGEPNLDAVLFEIQPGASRASFTVEEILRGEPNTVVGVTDQVAGQIAIDPDEPQNIRVGTILIEARSLATDDNQRNRMIRNFVLSTDQFEYIAFTPATIGGLPLSVAPGNAYPVQIDGQLTIKDVTRDVAFDAVIVPVSESELHGTASTVINQKDFGITIPQVPFVASVSDEVKLDLNFVARATELEASAEDRG
jgi:polyisoprenoid-binding protein YceI